MTVYDRSIALTYEFDNMQVQYMISLIYSTTRVAFYFQTPGKYFQNTEWVSTTTRVEFFQNPDFIFLNQSDFFSKHGLKFFYFN